MSAAKLGTASARGRALFDLRFLRCARCLGDHDGVIAYPFQHAPRGYSHFATCPTNGQPILVKAIKGQHR